VALRVILFIVILILSLLGYLTYLNHEISTTIFLVKGKPLPTSLPAVIIISFASGALIVFLASLIRDLLEGWKELRTERKAKKRKSLQVEIERGLNSLTKGDLEKGKIHLTNALKIDPENLSIYVQLSEIHAREGHLEAAFEALERALAIDSQNTKVILKKARLYSQMGNMKLATELLEQVRTIDPENQTILAELRDLYVQQKRWEEALDLQTRVVRGVRKGADASREEGAYLGFKFEYAQSLTTDGSDESLERALKLCKEVVRQQKEFQPAYLLLGNIYQKQKRWAEAGKILAKGFRVSRNVIFLHRLEDLYLKRDDHKTLLKIYRRILENNPDNLVISFLYSRLCLKLNMPDEAMDELVEISKREKDIPAIHGLMAEVFAHKGQLGKAVREYKKTTELTGSLQLPFFCRSCRRESLEWIARCPSCNQWNTYFQAYESSYQNPD